MTQSTVFSPRPSGDREGLLGSFDLAQRAAGFVLEAAAAVSVGIAKEIGGVLLGRELSDAPQHSFTLEDGEAHSRGAAASATVAQLLR